MFVDNLGTSPFVIKLDEMEKFLNEQDGLLEEYDERLVRMLIEKVTVFDDKLTVEFKSGAEIEV